MSIEVRIGDIFAIEADALVVPGNVQPDLGWGSHIAESILTQVAPEVLHEREQFGDIPLGNACITKGTGTPFKYLIHASVLNKYDFNPLFLLRIKQRTSDSTLIHAVRNTRKIAEAISINRIAISAMGAGIGGMNYKKCCQLTFGELSNSNLTWIFAAYKPRHKRIAESLASGA